MNNADKIQSWIDRIEPRIHYLTPFHVQLLACVYSLLRSDKDLCQQDCNDMIAVLRLVAHDAEKVIA